MNYIQACQLCKQAGFWGNLLDSFKKFDGKMSGKLQRGWGRIKGAYDIGANAFKGPNVKNHAFFSLMGPEELARLQQFAGRRHAVRQAWRETRRAAGQFGDVLAENPGTTTMASGMLGLGMAGWARGRNKRMQVAQARQQGQAQQGLGKTGSVQMPRYKDAMCLIKLAEKSYEDYEAEYMNDPERQKILNRGSVSIPLLLTLMGAYGGGLVGTGVNAAKEARNGNFGNPVSLGGTGTGALIGALIGLAGGKYVSDANQEFKKQHMRDEAWRYAMMKAQGKFDPSKTLV